ncbi:MAG: FMN-binding negative transcriptional regulator [Gammaproteobacteria bacterium]|nr:FMN-binding negative transcriptional regulator [Gammaproteobacteria bacterium]
MYNPKYFRETEHSRLLAVIEQAPLATLVSVDPEQVAEDTGKALMISHLPLIAEPVAGDEEAGQGRPPRLLGHLAKANPHARLLQRHAPVLAIFHGPNGYVSPSWYPGKLTHGRVVPTWNYAVVHAHCRAYLSDDPGVLRAHLEQLTDSHEAALSGAWRVSDAPADFIDAQLGEIHALTLEVDRLVGKFKLSQNRDQTDRQGVLRGLSERGPRQAELVELMQAVAARSPAPEKP